jgi:hypothetical protein
LFFRANFSDNKIELESQPLTSELCKNFQSKFQSDDQDLKLN